MRSHQAPLLTKRDEPTGCDALRVPLRQLAPSPRAPRPRPRTFVVVGLAAAVAIAVGVVNAHKPGHECNRDYQANGSYTLLFASLDRVQHTSCATGARVMGRVHQWADPGPEIDPGDHRDIDLGASRHRDTLGFRCGVRPVDAPVGARWQVDCIDGRRHVSGHVSEGGG